MRDACCASTNPSLRFGVGRLRGLAQCCWPPGWAASPTLYLKPNAEPGLTNKLLARISTRIATGYEISARAWGKKKKPLLPVARCAGNSFPSNPGGSGRRFVCSLPAASQGRVAHQPDICRRHGPPRRAQKKNELAIVHQTGERDYNAVRTAYARREINAEVVPFLTNMAETLCLGRCHCLPSWSYYRSGNRRRGTSRHLYPLRKSHRQPPIAQRAGNDSRGCRPLNFRIGNSPPKKLTGENFLSSRPSPRRSKKNSNRRARARSP